MPLIKPSDQSLLASPNLPRERDRSDLAGSILLGGWGGVSGQPKGKQRNTSALRIGDPICFPSSRLLVDEGFQFREVPI